ncbi:MAG: TRAP transporter substrate-binding protein [Betaproteobacteria bacterium]|nr:TRAP transporter substrate-binding protein [Betaproteobacteria bacterium]
MRISAIFAAALTALGATVVSGIASAQTVELKFASSAPPTSPWAKQIDRFAAYMDAETKGALKISPFFNSQLGSENDAIAQVSRGRLDMGSFTAASVALQVPEIALVQLPFYFSTAAQRDCVLDNHAQKPMTEALAKKGLRFLRWGEVGAVHLPGKKAYVTPADVRGIKVGVVTNKLNNEFWKAMGANPVPTAVAEVSSSMQTGLIDTYPTPFAFYVPSGLNKIAPTMTKFPLWDAAGVTLMNLGIYEKLSPEVKAALERETEKYPNSLYRAEIRGVDAALTNVAKGAGGTVVDTTAEQRAEWQKVLGNFWTTMAKEMGPEGEKFFAVLEAGKKSCENAK